MKIKTSALFGTALMLLTVVSCAKKDIQPVIKLNGANEVSISLGENYVEMGASAIDNKDGDITGEINITGEVNKDLAGEYRVYYNVTDSDGNDAATSTRYVKVVNDADFMVGTYSATPTCSGSGTVGQYNTSVTASATSNNKIYIRKILYSVEDTPVIGTVDGITITIPLQTVGDHTIEGTAVIAGDNFLLSVTLDGFFPYDCVINHNKL